MFASDGWFWDDPIRSETKQVLRGAARAVRIVDGLAGTRLEEAFVADLTVFRSPSHGVDGAEIYREALVAIGQPGGPRATTPTRSEIEAALEEELASEPAMHGIGAKPA